MGSTTTGQALLLGGSRLLVLGLASVVTGRLPGDAAAAVATLAGPGCPEVSADRRRKRESRAPYPGYGRSAARSTLSS